MRGLLSALFVLVASASASAQPALTPPMPGEPILVPPQPRAAHGVYFSEGLFVWNVHDDAALDGAIGARVAIGYRRKQLAFELWGGGGAAWSRGSYDSSSSYLSLPDGAPQPTRDGEHHDSGGLALVGFDVKYIKTVSRYAEVYARGRLSHAYAGSLGDGRGLGLAAGAQLKGKVPVIGFLFWPLFFTNWGPKCTAAVFAETGYEFYRLHGYRSTDLQVTQWTLGFAVGSDF